MKNIYLFAGGIALISLSSCSHDRSMSGKYEPNNPGYEYAPEGDMYNSVAYEPMSQYDDNHIVNNLKSNSNPYNRDSMNMRMPVTGTVARGKLSYYFPYANTLQDYERAAGLQNPMPADPKTIAQGKILFETYCWQCHGSEESPKGSLVAAGKFPPPTWDFERKTLLVTLPEGKMFFTITYGKNLMGPHGPIVAPDQRWKIIRYLKSIAASAPAPTAKTGADSTKTGTPATQTATKK